jgi:hypothetical protein
MQWPHQSIVQVDGLALSSWSWISSVLSLEDAVTSVVHSAVGWSGTMQLVSNDWKQLESRWHGDCLISFVLFSRVFSTCLFVNLLLVWLILLIHYFIHCPPRLLYLSFTLLSTYSEYIVLWQRSPPSAWVIAWSTPYAWPRRPWQCPARLMVRLDGLFMIILDLLTIVMIMCCPSRTLVNQCSSVIKWRLLYSAIFPPKQTQSARVYIQMYRGRSCRGFEPGVKVSIVCRIQSPPDYTYRFWKSQTLSPSL